MPMMFVKEGILVGLKILRISEAIPLEFSLVLLHVTILSAWIVA